MLEIYANTPTPAAPETAWSTLAAGVNASITTFTLNTPWRSHSRGLLGSEIVIVSAGYGTTTITVTRGAEGTTAASHASGDGLFGILTAAALLNNPGPTTTAGDLPYMAAGNSMARLPAGANGTYLRYQGGLPTAAAIQAGDLPDLSLTYVTPATLSATLSAALASYVPTTRTVNGHALSANVTVTAGDVGLGSVENAAASGLYVPLTRTVNSKPLSSNITLTASDVWALSSTLPGSNTQLLFNNSGSLGASASLTWDGERFFSNIAPPPNVGTGDLAWVSTVFGPQTSGGVDFNDIFAVAVSDGYAGVQYNWGFIAAAGDIDPVTGAATTPGDLVGLGYWWIQHEDTTQLGTRIDWGFRINSTTLENRTPLSGNGLGDVAIGATTQDFPSGLPTVVDGNIFVDGATGNTRIRGTLTVQGASASVNGIAIVTTSASQALSNKTGNISQWTNNSGYLTSVTAHNLLSATHGDTTAGSVARGDLVTGQGASPTWKRFAKGTANQVLAMDGSGVDVVWTTLSGGGDAFTSNPLSQFAATTSLQLKGVISDETGSGALVFATSPALVTPDLGTPSAAVLTSATGLPIATGVSGLGTGVATFLATPSSANLATAVTDETGSGVLVFGTSPTFTTTGTLTRTAVGVTSADGWILQNTTAAAVGAQQFSPRLRLTGQGWKTTSTASSQAVDWILENQPVQGAASPTTNLVISSQVNAAGYVSQAVLSSAGMLTLGGAAANAQWLSLQYAASEYLKFGFANGVYGMHSGSVQTRAGSIGFGNGTVTLAVDTAASPPIVSIASGGGTSFATFNLKSDTTPVLTLPTVGLTTKPMLSIQSTSAQTADAIQVFSDAGSTKVFSVAATGTATFGEAANVVVGTSTGTKWGTATGQKQGWWGATPVVQQVLATGAGATVDNVIALLQTLGLCKQS